MLRNELNRQKQSCLQLIIYFFFVFDQVNHQFQNYINFGARNTLQHKNTSFAIFALPQFERILPSLCIRTKRSSGICVYTVPDKFLSVQVHNLYAFVAVQVFVRINEQIFVRIGRYRVNASPIRTKTCTDKNLSGTV